ncbi:MAG: TetR/AcrR family transcriptional regulator [Novosphingobium sp.]|nr:TetR/AcrR family transcriptional regulator [Novosphingobium sp.]
MTALSKRRAADYGKRGERTRKRILDAAFRLIGHKDGLSVRVEDVCAELPISRAAFYHYFASFEELLAALSFEISHEFNQAVMAATSSMTSFAQRADAGTRYYLEKAQQDASWGWAMIHISANGPLFGAETAAAALATIEHGIATGEFDVATASFGRDLLQGTVLSVIRSELASPTLGNPAPIVSRLILRGLGVPVEIAERIVAQPLPEMNEGGSGHGRP